MGWICQFVIFALFLFGGQCYSFSYFSFFSPFFSFFLSPFSFSYFLFFSLSFSLFFISPFLSSPSSSPSRSPPPSPPPPPSPLRSVAAHDLIFNFYLYYMKFCILFQIIQLLHLLMFFVVKEEVMHLRKHIVISRRIIFLESRGYIKI